MALYALVTLTVDDRARLRGVLAAALVGAIGNVGSAVLQIAAGGPYLVPLSKAIDAKLDLSGEAASSLVTGVFSHPNAFAVYLMPVVIFLLVATWVGFGEVRRIRPVMVAVLAPSLVVLDLTYAKGVFAWLAAGIAFLVLPRRFDRYRVWLAAAAAVGGIVALTWFSIHAFLEGDLVFGTIISRIELWLATWNIVRTDPFVAALGNGGALLAHQPLVTIDYTNAHNAWLDQALTYGVPALVLYLATYLTALRSLARMIQSAGHPMRAIALASFAALVAILGESFFEPTNHGIVLQSQLLLAFAIAAVLPGLCSPPVRGPQVAGYVPVPGGTGPAADRPAITSR
jgi:O-antigen ligase